jgi:rhodanese-related sulfurtransferase
VSDQITRDELRTAISAGAVTVVDALPSRPYQKRHLPRAINVVAEHPDEAVRATLSDPAAAIAVYSTDDDCERAPDLVARLRKLGYTNVRLYPDGIDDWVAAGLPVEAGL